MILIGILMLFGILVSQAHDQPNCVNLGNVYELICSGGAGYRVTQQGIPGKRGAKGFKGEPGLTGSKGEQGTALEPSYEIVEEMFSQIRDELETQQMQRYEVLSATLNDTKDMIEQFQIIFQKTNAYCHVIYKGKCFWIEDFRQAKRSFQQAFELCAARGGIPANIYSENHYNIVMEYARTFTTNGRGSIDPWIGLTYNLENLQIYLSDETTIAPFLKWYHGYPIPEYCCNVGVHVEADSELSTQNMFTDSSTSFRGGVLCEK